MNYPKPTTSTELYAQLDEIYTLYRIRRGLPEEPEFGSLNISKINYVPPTDEELTAKATLLLKGKHARETFERKSKLQSEIDALTLKIFNVNEEKESQTEKIEQSFAEDEKRYRKNSALNGTALSETVTYKLSELIAERDKKISSINEKYSERIAELNALKEAKQTEKEGVEEEYASLHTAEIVSKTEELKKEREEKSAEVDKYNKSVDEKIKKYENYVEEKKSDLKIKYLTIRTIPYSKEELVNIGYYKLCIGRIKEYYSDMTYKEAYNDIKSQSSLCLYLDDFYTSVVYYYRVNATTNEEFDYS